MGMIKLPNESVEYFAEKYNEIFLTGELSEGKWNKKVADWSCEYTSAPYALAVNSNGSGLFALLRILKQYRNKEKVFFGWHTYKITTFVVFGVKQSFWYPGSSPVRVLLIFAFSPLNFAAVETPPCLRRTQHRMI